MLGNIIQGVVGLLFGKMLPTGDTAYKAGGIFNGSIAVIGLLVGGGMWLFGPGREWTITMNGLELTGLIISGSVVVPVLLDWFRRMGVGGGDQ